MGYDVPSVEAMTSKNLAGLNVLTAKVLSSALQVAKDW